MLFYIVLAIIIGIPVYLGFISKHKDLGLACNSFFMLLIFLGSIFLFISLILNGHYGDIVLTKNRLSLVSTRDGSNIHGNFFLGSGRIKEVDYYIYSPNNKRR